MIKPLVARYLRQRPAVMVMLAGWFFLSEAGGDSRASLAVIVLGMALFAPLVIPSGVNAFTCALPIRGRDLIMSRVLAILAVPVIPVVTWVALGAMSGEPAPTILLPSVQLAALVAAFVGAAAVAWVHYTVPDALAIPYKEVAGSKQEPERRAGTGADAAWWSVARTALPPGYVLYCVLLVGAAVLGMATPLYCVILLFLPVIIRQRTAWLTALPVSDRQRLRLIILPTVLVFVTCIEVGRVLRLSVLERQEGLSGDWRVWMIDAAVLMVLGLMVVMLTEVDGVLSRRLRGTVALVLRELATLPVAAVIAVDIMLSIRGKAGIIALTTRILHDSTASYAVHAWSVIVPAVVLLVTAYLLLERQFRRSGTSGNAAAQAA